jgi:hypothetical protein
VRIHRQTAVHVVTRLQIIVAPTVRPNPGRAQDALAGAEYDSDRLVVEDEWQAGHDLSRISSGLSIHKEGKTRAAR